MYQINIPKLKGKMTEQNIRNFEMAKKLEISSNTFTNYMKHPEKMPYSVILRIVEVLKLTDDESRDIFFSKKLA